MATKRRRGAGVYTAEALIMLIVGGLVFAGFFAGWLIGHYSTSAKTTTVTVAAGARHTTAPVTTAPTAATPTATTAAATATTAAAATTSPASTATSATSATAKHVSAQGKAVFTQNCGSCHTLADAGTSGTVGPNLDQLKPGFHTVQHQVTNGGSVMPAFGGRLSKAQINAVAAYVSNVAGKG